MGRSEELQQQIETTLRTRVPEVEVLLAELPSPGLLRVTIDRPDGAVDLDLCQRVSRELTPLRDRVAIEGSSPGALPQGGGQPRGGAHHRRRGRAAAVPRHAG